MHTPSDIIYLVVKDYEPVSAFTTEKEARKEIYNRQFLDYSNFDSVYEDSGYWIKPVKLSKCSTYEKPKKVGVFSYFWLYNTSTNEDILENCSFNEFTFFDPKKRVLKPCPSNAKFGEYYKFKRKEDENFDTVEALLLLDIPEDMSFADFINYAKQKIVELYLRNLKENKNIIYID